MSQAKTLASTLKKHALEVGFDLAGIAPASAARDDLKFARQWAERGYNGQMRYLANPKRFDLRAVLPSVQSVICVGLIYNTSFPYSTEAITEEVRSQESEARRRIAE